MEANKIIITGDETRIGAAIAKKLSGPGVEMVIHYNRSKSEAEKLQKELSKNKTKVYLVKGDLAKEEDLKNNEPDEIEDVNQNERLTIFEQFTEKIKTFLDNAE